MQRQIGAFFEKLEWSFVFTASILIQMKIQGYLTNKIVEEYFSNMPVLIQFKVLTFELKTHTKENIIYMIKKNPVKGIMTICS